MGWTVCRVQILILGTVLPLALCHSLATGIGNPVPDQTIQADSNIDMAWKTFAGPHDELYWALVKERCLQACGGVTIRYSNIVRAVQKPHPQSEIA